MARKKKAVVPVDPYVHVPIAAKTKDLGAPKSIDIDPDIVEHLSNLQPHELADNLAPHVREAVMKRMLEKRNAQPRVPKAGVVRDKTTGRAVPKTPAAPVVTTTADPVIRKFKKDQLVTVRPRKQKKQTPIAVPQPGQAGTLDGKTVRVTPENMTQIYDEKRRTNLPTAGRAAMTPASRPEVEGAILPRTLRSSQNRKNIGGFAAEHSVVAPVVHAALGHLQTMADNPRHSPEFHAASEAFNVLHSKVGQIGNKVLHKVLGMGKSVIDKAHGTPHLKNALKIHRGAVLGRLEEGRIAEQSRAERTGQGQGGNNGS